MNFLLYFILLVITALVIWFQTIVPIKFGDFLQKYSFVVYLMSLITGFCYVQACKIGADIFNDAWTLRFIAFSVNTIIFGVMTYLFITPNINMKTILSIILSICIISIQCFWD